MPVGRYSKRANPLYRVVWRVRRKMSRRLLKRAKSNTTEHISESSVVSSRLNLWGVMSWAEGVGFEPTRLAPSGFQDRRNRPLCHPSAA